MGERHQDVLDQPDGVDKWFKETVPFDVVGKEYVCVQLTRIMRSICTTQDPELTEARRQGLKWYCGYFILGIFSLAD